MYWKEDEIISPNPKSLPPHIQNSILNDILRWYNSFADIKLCQAKCPKRCKIGAFLSEFTFCNLLGSFRFPLFGLYGIFHLLARAGVSGGRALPREPRPHFAFQLLSIFSLFAPGKCLETGETTKSLECVKCLETGKTTKSLEYRIVLKQEKQQNPLNVKKQKQNPLKI